MDTVPNNGPQPQEVPETSRIGQTGQIRVAEDQYHVLGRKTFLISLFERTNGAFAFLLAAAVLLVVSNQKSLVATPLGNIAGYALMGAEIAAALFVIIFAITFFISWLMYRNFKFALGENSLKIKRGILEREEIAIPYRQIQDVDIERSLSFQMMGLSRLMILTAGREDVGKPGEDDSEGILPALDKNMAEWLQHELLERANIQKVTEEKIED